VYKRILRCKKDIETRSCIEKELIRKGIGCVKGKGTWCKKRYAKFRELRAL